MTKDITSDHLLDYVRGTLAADGRKAVELACQEDQALAEELAYYTSLTSALSDDRPESDELQWHRLSRAIDEISAPIETKTAANDTARVWRWAACAMAVLLIGQTALTTLDFGPTDNDDATYVTVTQTELDDRLRISFVPSATELDIRTLLLDVDAKIVSGPSALGIYVLSFDTGVNQEAAFLTLLEKSDIVETVFEN